MMNSTKDKKKREAAGRPRWRRVKWMSLALLFLLQTVTPIVLRTAAGTPWGWIGGGVIAGPIMFAFWAGFCLCWWRILEVSGRWSLRNEVAGRFLFLLPVILISTHAVYCAWPSVRAAQILSNGELAPLPPSAKQIKVHTWSSPMSGEEYLTFSATRDDIEQFLSTSPILRDVEYLEHSEGEVTLFYPRQRSMSAESLRSYVSRPLPGPPWFMKDPKGSLRRYRIFPSGYHSSCTVIIDERHNLVYVRLCFS